MNAPGSSPLRDQPLLRCCIDDGLLEPLDLHPLAIVLARVTHSMLLPHAPRPAP